MGVGKFRAVEKCQDGARHRSLPQTMTCFSCVETLAIFLVWIGLLGLAMFVIEIQDGFAGIIVT